MLIAIIKVYRAGSFIQFVVEMTIVIMHQNSATNPHDGDMEIYNQDFVNSRHPVPRNMSDVKLIPPYDQVVLDNAFTKIDQWSITLLRDAILEAGDALKKSQFNLRRCASDMYLAVLPCTRFMLAALGMLTVEHTAAGVSLLLNSGVLALTQVRKCN